MRGPLGARTSPVRPNTTPGWDFCQFWLYQFPYVSVRVSYGALVGPTWAPYGSRRIWKHWRFPCGVRTMHGHRTGTRGVLRIIRPNHKCTVVSSRPGPVAWCDHENSTDVKFLRARHSALRARNRMGDKKHTGPVVRGDWGITEICGRHPVVFSLLSGSSLYSDNAQCFAG